MLKGYTFGDIERADTKGSTGMIMKAVGFVLGMVAVVGVIFGVLVA